MKTVKSKVLVYLLVVAMIASMMSLVSCNNDPDAPGAGAEQDQEQGQGGEQTQTHTHAYTQNVVSKTCTENGYTEYTCACGDSYRDNVIPASHNMVDIAPKEPTCSAEGHTGGRVCSVCGQSEEGTYIPKLDHQYVLVDYTYPTLNTAGEKRMVCKICNTPKAVGLDALSVNMPAASEVIYNMISAMSISLEVSEGTELIYVMEPNEGATANGTKQSVFVEVAEAAVDGTGDKLKAHLNLRVGLAEATLTGIVPADSVAVNKANAEYLEVYITVDGDIVTFDINDDGVQSVNMSETLYEAVAEMFGFADYETMAEAAYLMQGLTKLMPITEKAFNDASAGITSISPEYIDRIESVLSLFGEDVLDESTDANGNTVYELDPSALKAFIEEIDGKTFAEYINEMYGEEVANEFASFLRALPDKTVKDIAKAAVDFAEASGVEVDDIYTLIDIYVYFATETEFDIQNEIETRYGMTIAELLAELEGVSEESKAEYIQSVKDSLANCANEIETVTIDELLSSMLIGESEGFTEMMYDAIGTLDESLVFTFVEDANGEIIAVDLVAKDYNGDVVGGGSMAVDKQTVGGNTTTTTTVSFRDAENELHNYRIVDVNGTVTEFKFVVKGYSYDSYYDEYNDCYVEWKTLETVCDVEFYDRGNGTTDTTVIMQNVKITVNTNGDDFTVNVYSNNQLVSKIIHDTSDTVTTFEVRDDQNRLFYIYVERDINTGKVINVVVDRYAYVQVETANQTTETQHIKEITYGYRLVDNVSGMDYAYINVNDATVVIGYEVADDGVEVIITNTAMDVNYVEFSAKQAGDSVTAEMVVGDGLETYLDVTVTLTEDYTLAIDLDRLLISEGSYTEYVQFNGAIDLDIN